MPPPLVPDDDLAVNLAGRAVTTVEIDEIAPIHWVPDEVALGFFSQLNVQELVTCSFVCKDFKRLSEDNLLWKPLLKARFPFCDISKTTDYKKTYLQNHLIHSNIARGRYILRPLGKSECQAGELMPFATDLMTFGDGKLFTIDVLDGEHNWIQVWDPKTSKQLLSFFIGQNRRICSLYYDNGKLFLTKSHRDGFDIEVWDPKTGHCLHTLRGHENYIDHLYFSDGMLISASRYDVIKVWNLETGECVCTLAEPQRLINALLFAEGKLIYSHQGAIKVWDLNKGECIFTLTPHGHSYSDTMDCLAYSDGKCFSGSRNHAIYVWDLKDGNCLGILTGHEAGVCKLLFANGMLFSGSGDGIVKVWNPETLQCLHTLNHNRKERAANMIDSLTFTQGMLFSISYDGVINVWDPQTGHCLSTLQGKKSQQDENSKQLFFSQGMLCVKSALQERHEVLDFTPTRHDHDDIFEDIANQFLNADFLALAHFNRLQRYDKPRVFCELYSILGSPHSDDESYGEHAFYNTHGRSSTSKQRAQAIYQFAKKYGSFENLTETALARFSAMPEKEKNGVFYELYLIFNPTHNNDPNFGKHAFYETHGLSSTSEQKALAIYNHLARKIAKLFEGNEIDQKIAMERFNRLPLEIQWKVYYQMYKILNPASNDDSSYGQHAFNGKRGLSSTPEQKALAINNALNSKN